MESELLLFRIEGHKPAVAIDKREAGDFRVSLMHPDGTVLGTETYHLTLPTALRAAAGLMEANPPKDGDASNWFIE